MAPTATVFPGDFLKVHNLSDRDITLTWDGRSVVIPAGKVRAATFEQVVNHFGHPASGAEPFKLEDESGAWHVVPPREEERARVSVKGGWDLGSARAGGLQTLVPPPRVEVFDQDDNRIWTVVEDPTGEHQMPSGGKDDYGAEDQINRLKKQLQALEMAMKINAGARDLNVPDAAVPPSGSPAELPDLDVPVDE